MSFGENLDELVERSTNGLHSKHESWERVRLGEVAKLTNGFPFKSKSFNEDEGTPIVRIRDVMPGKTATYYAGPVDDPRMTFLEDGQVAIGMDGDFNCRIWRGGKALLNQRVCTLQTDEDVYSQSFLAFALPGYLKLINDHTSSITVKHLSSRTVQDIPLPLPPLREQQRIVEKIETQFAELDKGEEALREVQKLLARYRQSVLKAAVTGTLTADWRAANCPPQESGNDLLTRILKTRRETWQGRGKYKDPVEPDADGLPKLPQGWVWASLSQLTHIKGGVTVDKKREAADPVTLPYLRVANVQNGFLDLDEIKEITVDRSKADACLLQPMDILLNEGGDRDKLGRGWVWSGEINPCIHQNHVYRARPVIPELSSHFISYYANAFGQPFFMAKGTQSVNLASISLTAISGLPIPLPPLDEQQELVAIIEEKIALIENGLRACETEFARAKTLRQSILKDAFTGKLVPQDPSDEPAEKLLERIRAARAEKPKAKRKKAAA